MKAFDYNGQRNVSGERIRQARTRQRCTQAGFELRAIAGALGVTTDWLVGETDEEEK